MDLTALRYFFETARTGSIRRAAQRVHVAPSAISRQIAKLEHDLGTDLLERHPNGVTLTAAGGLLVEQLESTIRDLARVRGRIDELKGLHRGEVTIHAIEGLVDNYLSDAIRTFHERHPGITFNLMVASTDQIIEAILTDRTDIGVALNPPGRRAIQSCGGWEEPVQAIVAPTHPLSKRQSITLVELADHFAVLPEPTFGIRQLIDRGLHRQMIVLRQLMTTNSILATTSMARHGAGYTLMPFFAVARECGDGSLVAIGLPEGELEPAKVDICIHKSRQLPLAARAFLSSLLENVPVTAQRRRKGRADRAEPLAR